MRLRNLEEGLNETKVCKVCGDKMHNPTTDCDHDCHDEHGDHWITEGQYDWYARDYVKSMAPERMAGLDPIAKNAFLLDLEKTYPGIKKELGEGTWAWPDQAWQVKELDKLLKSPIQANKAADVLYNIIGDDELYDEIDAAIKRDPQSDVRPVVIRRLKSMGLIESNEELTEWSWKKFKNWFKGGRPDIIGSKLDTKYDVHTVDLPVGNLQQWLKEDPEAEAKVDTLTQMQDAYKYNEDRNAHSENILMLAHAFGDRGEIKAVEGLMKTIKQQGYTTPEQSEMMYNAIHKKYFKELFPVNEVWPALAVAGAAGYGLYRAGKWAANKFKQVAKPHKDAADRIKQYDKELGEADSISRANAGGKPHYKTDHYTDPDGEEYECMACNYIGPDWVEDDNIKDIEDPEANAMLCPKCHSEHYYTYVAESYSDDFEYSDNWVEGPEFSDQQIKMAFGVLNDPRYRDGNYDGAVAVIEKIAKGLSDHPSVANALKKANESIEDIKELTGTRNTHPYTRGTLGRQGSLGRKFGKDKIRAPRPVSNYNLNSFGNPREDVTEAPLGGATPVGKSSGYAAPTTHSIANRRNLDTVEKRDGSQVQAYRDYTDSYQHDGAHTDQGRTTMSNVEIQKWDKDGNRDGVDSWNRFIMPGGAGVATGPDGVEKNIQMKGPQSWAYDRPKVDNNIMPKYQKDLPKIGEPLQMKKIGEEELNEIDPSRSPWTISGKHPGAMNDEELQIEIEAIEQQVEMTGSSPTDLMRLDALYNYLSDEAIQELEARITDEDITKEDLIQALDDVIYALPVTESTNEFVYDLTRLRRAIKEERIDELIPLVGLLGPAAMAAARFGAKKAVQILSKTKTGQKVGKKTAEWWKKFWNNKSKAKKIATVGSVASQFTPGIGNFKKPKFGKGSKKWDATAAAYKAGLSTKDIKAVQKGFG